MPVPENNNPLFHLVFVLLLVMTGGCFRCGRGASDAASVSDLSEDVPPPPLSTDTISPAVASAAGSSVTVGDLFGINEAIAVPQRLVRRDRIDEAQIEAHLQGDVEATLNVGARWVRVNSATYPFFSWYNFKRDPSLMSWMDRYVALVQKSGLELHVVLGPWPGNRTAAFTDHYVPDDMDAYSEWIRTVVERYDGDGTDDAPDLLRPIRVWEVDNEPDLHNQVAPRGAQRQVDPSTFETPQEYAQVFLATARAIAQADPGAMVLNGGLFNTATTRSRDYLETVMAQKGVAAVMDAISVHVYFEDSTAGRFYAALDNAFQLADGRPVLVTETGVPSQKGRRPWVSPDYQARMLVNVYGEALARGVDRVFWHTLADPPVAAGSPGGYSTHSLYQLGAAQEQGGLDLKPSGKVYRRLVSLLADLPLDTVTVAPVSGGRAVKLGTLGWLVYEGQQVQGSWTSGTVLDLLTGQTRAVNGPVAAPALVRP